MRWVSKLPKPPAKLDIKILGEESDAKEVCLGGGNWVQRVYKDGDNPYFTNFIKRYVSSTNGIVPPCFASLQKDFTDFFGYDDDGDPVDGGIAPNFKTIYFKMPSEWESGVSFPFIGRYISAGYHPGAEMNIRTLTATPGGHGNQATYDINGDLITSGVAAGSADYGDAVNHYDVHQSHDVKPFDLAVELDGYDFVFGSDMTYPKNIDPNGANININKYFEVRPVIQVESQD